MGLMGRADVKWRRPSEKSGQVVAAGNGHIDSGRTDLSAAPIGLEIGAVLAEPSMILRRMAGVTLPGVVWTIPGQRWSESSNLN